MTAEPRYAPDRFERAIAAIHALLAERGLGRHAIFGEANEGIIFPDETEAMSGYVLDERGRVFAFWTGWDSQRQRPIFVTWREVIPAGRLATDREHLEARRALGLDQPARRSG